MLKIHIDTSQLLKFNPKVEKSFYAHVWVTSHPSHSILLTPRANDSHNNGTDYERMQFYLSLMAMADSDNTGTQFAHVCPVTNNEMANKLRYYTAKSGGHIKMPDEYPYPTLCIAIYEETTVGIPSENGEMDFRISNALNISSNHSKSLLDRELLFSTRVGNIEVPWGDLLKIASNISNDKIIELKIPLIDDRLVNSKNSENFEDIGNGSRGTLLLHIHSETSQIQMELLKSWMKLSLDKYKLAMQKEAQSAPELKTVGNFFVTAYVKSFPDFKMPFANVMDTYGGSNSIVYTSALIEAANGGDKPPSLIKLVPTTANIVDIHMPTIQPVGGISIPLCYYHLHTSRHETISHMHEKYLGDIFDAACVSFNCTTDEIADIIHDKLDSNVYDTSTQKNFLVAMDVISTFLTGVATAGKYRSDYRIYKGGRYSLLESIDFDRITGASDSEDCEGVDLPTEEISQIVLFGRSDKMFNQSSNISRPESIDNDRLWKALKSNNMLIDNTGYWNHKGLTACQRILAYMTPVAILGSVTDAFPGMASLREADINDMDEAQQAWNEKIKSSDSYKRIENFIYGSNPNINATSGAHQYSILMPVYNLLKMYGNGLRLEETKIDSIYGSKLPTLERYEQDQKMVHRFYQLEKIYEDSIGGDYNNNLMLPSLLLESTCRTSGLLVGASYWLKNEDKASSNIISDVVDKEKQQRLWMNNVKKDRLMQKNIIQVRDLHSMKFLKGDLMERRASKFYRDVLHGTSRLLYYLLGKGDDASNIMTFSFLSKNQNGNIVWGVPIEQVIRNEPNVCAIPILHRIPYMLRRDFHRLSKEYILPFLPPITIGRYSETDKSLIYPKKITFDELVAMLKNVHSSSVSQTEFNSIISDLKTIITSNINSSLNYREIYDKINSSRTYFVSLKSATLIGDWKRLISFIKNHNERIVHMIHQKLVPVFGAQEILIVTDAKLASK